MLYSKALRIAPPPGTTYVATSGRVFKGRFYSFLNFLGLVSKKRCYLGKVYGFTLAEVLVTLGIIGVVAALTIPAVITNYQKQETLSRLKKAYSIVQQAIKLSEVENESVANWDNNLNGHAFFEKYIKKYVQYTQEITPAELWSMAPRKLLNGSNYGGTTYAAGSGTATNFILSDGSMITLNFVTTDGIWVGIDTNGIKKPNQMGKDTFLFLFSPKHGLQPLGGDGTPDAWSYRTYSRENIMGSGSNRCSKTGTGYWCSALIMNDQWEIAKDYPW